MAKQSKAWDDTDDAYNNGDGLRTEGDAVAVDRGKGGYKTPNTPELNAWGVGDKAVRPKDVVKSMTKDSQDKMRIDGAKSTQGYKKGDRIPVYHKGTSRVPKTGLAVLKKGEAVLNEKQASKMRRSKKV